MVREIRSSIAAVLTVLTVLVGCSSDASSNVPPTTITPALAPSQLTAETVAPPPVPDVCDPADLAWWAAAADVDDHDPASVSAIIRVENRGDRWCEVDISESPHFAPEVEPDVWLEPGDLATLWFGPDGTECTDRQVARSALIRMDDTVVEVPMLAVGSCLRFTAFFPETGPTAPCDAADLEATLAPAGGFVVVRTTTGCDLGTLDSVSVDGERLAEIQPADGEAVAVEALLPGDVAGFRLDAGVCPATSAGVMTFGASAGVAIDLPACATVELGSARPYFGGTAGPRVGDLGDLDVASLDPFAS